MAPGVTSRDRFTSCYIHHTHTKSLRPPQIHSQYKCVIPSFTYIPFIPLLNLYQTAHSNLPPFSQSRCPSMMVWIIEIVIYTKPTEEYQYLLRSSCYPLHTKRTFLFSLALRIRRICSSNETFKLRCNELTQAQYLNRRG